MNKLKKEMNEFINKIDEPKCYMIITESGVRVNADTGSFLSMITCTINQFKEKISKEEFEKCVEYAYMSDEEIEKLAKEKSKDGLGKLKEILKLIEELDNE